MRSIIHIEYFSYLSYLFEHFIAHLISVGFVIKSLSYNYKTPNSCLTILCFLIKVGAGGRMWENLVGFDEFFLPFLYRRRQHVPWHHATQSGCKR